MICYNKRAQQNQQREKAHEEKSEGNQVQAFKSPFPVESHITHLIAPGMSRDSM